MSATLAAPLARADAGPPRLFTALAAASVALVALHLLWGAAETRTLAGEPVWLKPAKFALSFAVTFGTLALVEARLSPAVAGGRLLRGTAAVMAVCFAGEMAYIAGQAARGAASHWNVATPAAALAYSVMGVGAVLLTLGIGAVGLATLRDPAPHLSPALRAAVGWGFLATVPLVLATAATMSAGSGHVVGVHPEGGATVPLLGWSRVAGDLRPPHFLALHAMQAVPLWVLAREALGARPGRAEVALAVLLWSALTLAAFAQALAGRPLLG